MTSFTSCHSTFVFPSASFTVTSFWAVSVSASSGFAGSAAAASVAPTDKTTAASIAANSNIRFPFIVVPSFEWFFLFVPNRIAFPSARRYSLPLLGAFHFSLSEGRK